jgi:ribosome-associated protein
MARDLWDDAGHLMVDKRVAIPAGELTIKATKSGGPGGQHVNTSSTRVEVTWDMRHSAALADDQRALLELRLATKLDSRGVLRVTASDTRSQAQNRELALERLARTVRDALVVPRARRATKPTRSSKEQRIESKKRRGTTKRDRRKNWRGDD